jgi:glycosyltransferase involved in cell wall biosynthesis
MLRFVIIIPVHNEQAYLQGTVQSLLDQVHPFHHMVLVDDRSTDMSWQIIQAFQSDYPNIYGVQTLAESDHMPGGKVVKAFQAGLSALGDDWDVICKFDADLVFPANYLAEVAGMMESNPAVGICGGQCTVKTTKGWHVESVADEDHVRGALKAYRKACFEQIGGLKPAMGWDTLDELLAQCYHWQVKMLPELHVKHLRITGHQYTERTRYVKGAALYRMGYGLPLSLIAFAKMAFKERRIGRFADHLVGYFKAMRRGDSKLVTPKEAHFIRRFRWQRIFKKVLG